MRRAGAVVATASLVLAGVPAVAAAPSDPAGTVVSSRPATGPAALADAGRSTVVAYRSTSVTGRPTTMTGVVLVPKGTPPTGGWPLVTWSHMTTGAADRCAPSTATAENNELRRMTQGDAVVRRLLRARVAVAKPDYEGIGTAGNHPYLIGDSLATATADLASAARRLDPRIGSRWIAAGQSEGGVAALFTGEAGRRLPSNVRLLGVSAFVPPTRMDTLIQTLKPLPVANQLTGGLVALAGLILKGASTVDPTLRSLLAHGGLSAAAWKHWPDLEDRCYADLSASDSWGGLAPSQVPGPRGKEALDRLYAVIRDNDVRSLTLREVPVRLDVGVLDLVVPIVFSEELAATYRARGVDLTYSRWLADHSPVTDDGFAAGPAADWMVARLRAS